MTQKFRKKPVVIEAIQFTKDNIIDVEAFRSNISKDEMIKSANKGGDRWFEYEQRVIDNGIKIKTLEGEMTASLGDWIIKGVNGEFYPCKPDIFEKTYELA